MEYVVAKDEKTGEIIKVGRFKENGITESFRQGKWMSDPILYGELLDGLLEKISKTEAEKIIARQIESEKIAA